MALFTLGIEEEFQTIDPETRELKSHMSRIVEGGKTILRERIKQEMHQAVVEMGTGICKNIQEARDEVSFLRQKLFELADNQGLQIAAGGTHPFSDWQEQLITDDERYNKLIDEMRDVARGNLIFGLHVHVGIGDRTAAIQIMNQLRYFLPHIFALSVNSPFWRGRNTGFQSYRAKIFDKFPRTGIPEHFETAAEYDDYVNLLIKTNCIDNAKKIWWDLRLHPFFPTIEFRICDVPMRVDETICLTAIMQALVARLYSLRDKNLSYRTYPKYLINENKWRAGRWGVKAKLIDFGIEGEVPFSQLVNELLEFIWDEGKRLGSEKEISYISQIMKKGTGAERQLKVFEKTNDLKAVVDYMVKETKHGL